MDIPMVTIITPTYNCKPYIKETIESVLEQDYPKINYMVLDDGSTDGTRRMLEEENNLKYNKDRVKYYYRKKNKGEQKTVNEGLKSVQGKYFMIVNADDPLLPGAVSILVDFMEAHPDILVGYPEWDSINENGTFKAHLTRKEYDFLYMVRHHTCLPSVGSIFRSKVINMIGLRDISFHWLGDFDYWLRIGLVGQMAKVPATLATWRHRDGQESQTKSDARAREHIKIIDKLYSYKVLPEEVRQVENEARCWSCLVASAVSRSKLTLVKYVLKAVRYYPRLLYSLEFYHSLWNYAYYILRR